MMRRMITQTASILLVLLALSLVACGGSGGGSAEPSSGSPAPSPTEPEPTAPLEPAPVSDLPPLNRPEIDKTWLFIGQDNASVGGNFTYENGYVDHLGVPAGITSYVGFGFDCLPELPGLATTVDYGAGPINLKHYLDSSTLDGVRIHLSIDMAYNDSEVATANGSKGACIEQVARFMGDYPKVFFFVRPGYEFDGPHNHYDAAAFKQAFRRIVDTFLAHELTNFNTVMSSVTPATSAAAWERYWPGDAYVQWVGYSVFDAGLVSGMSEPATVQFARNKQKPVFIAEAAPRGYQLDELSEAQSLELWDNWYRPVFAHIEQYADIIGAFAYINADWESQALWRGEGWGDSRIQTNVRVRALWEDRMALQSVIGSPE
ncbi:hypothetical protein QWI17_08635 [Gilvimarinus sp. SDUM040013]|uniref:GH26 domain-containing protein n=1 Tax=Gilvimarinus gilvus TaxID=3058038 RepID=A0ABU4S0N8_9GAMM|nr:hypothetical protein [Gilvimarinus sp. SDUM040013]MDO3385902.1 hypothetical protein [Gilvimarinus sp. SDUM040013]MDX6850595.1 hypothetical protein [Gilvimarinus sp. SDUM040013]